MVIASTLALCAILATAPAPPPAPSTASEPAAKALAQGQFPWYDAKADALKPVTPPPRPREPKVPASNTQLPNVKVPAAAFSFGQIVVFTLIALGLAGLIALLAWALSRLQTPDVATPAPASLSTKATRVGDLPAGLNTGSGDPLAEAARLRAKGDYAAATLYLFSHQLLTLDRLRLARLMPGRTGRQLVRSVGNAPVRDLVTPSLRLFEEVYYGHKPPTAEAFEVVWERAQSLERMISGGAFR